MEAENIEEKMNSSGVPSASSSPSHEFSFTISLHSSSSATSTTSVTTPAEKMKQNQSPLAIDLTPADEIFFHGHLLPLHFLSHLHATAGSASSPRHSTNSMDSFTLPIHDILQEEDMFDIKTTPDNDEVDEDDIVHTKIGSFESKGRKHFSLFKWRKGSSADTKEQQQQQRETQHQEHKRKVNKFDVSQFVKRYVKMVKPLLLSPKGGGGAGRRESGGVRRQAYSFSGAVSPRDKRELRGRRGEFSAPASMRTSPTNSGLLLATSGVPSPSSDSTMEELQAAIQAAIAHCKNSVGAADQEKPTGISAVPVS